MADPAASGMQATGVMDMLDKYMTQMFGHVWGKFIHSNTLAIDSIEPGFMAAIYQFNLFTMIVVAIALLLVTLLATVNTATDGQPLGKAYHTLWTPFRMGFGILMVTPVKSLGGINVVQALILFCASLSIQGANMIYEKIMAGFRDTGNIYANVNAMPSSGIIYQMLRSDMCALVAQNKMGQTGRQMNIRAYQFNSGNTYGFRWASSKNKVDPECGQIIMACEGQAQKAKAEEASRHSLFNMLFSSGIKESHERAKLKMCKTIGKSIVAMYPHIHSLAQNIVNKDYGIKANEVGRYLKNAATAYYTVYKQGKRDLVANYKTNSTSALKDIYNQSQQQGWIMAGAWIGVVTHESSELSKYANIQPNVINDINPKPFSTLYKKVMTPELAKASAALAKASGLSATSVTQSGKADAYIPDTTPWSEVKSPEQALRKLIADPLLPVFNTWRLMIDGGNFISEDSLLAGNPIKVLVQWGETAYQAAGVVFASALAANAVAGGAKNSWWGNGPVAATITGAVYDTVKFMYGFVIGLMGAMLMIGFMLTTFLPMIPTIYWAMAVMGWFISLILIFIAAPLWAAVHALPDDRSSPVSMWAVNGYQMLFGVLVKPSLLVILLFTATVIASMGISLLVYVFDTAGITTVLTDAGDVNMGGILQSIGLLFLFGIVTVAIVNKAYTIVFTGPDRVIDVLGWKVLHSNVEDTEQRIQGNARETGSAMAGGFNKGMEGMTDRGSESAGASNKPGKSGKDDKSGKTGNNPVK